MRRCRPHLSQFFKTKDACDIKIYTWPSLADHGVRTAALRQVIGAATADVLLDRIRSTDRSASHLADLTSRLEVIEQQLAGRQG
jgi:hypothetical protein